MGNGGKSQSPFVRGGEKIWDKEFLGWPHRWRWKTVPSKKNQISFLFKVMKKHFEHKKTTQFPPLNQKSKARGKERKPGKKTPGTDNRVQNSTESQLMKPPAREKEVTVRTQGKIKQNTLEFEV